MNLKSCESLLEKARASPPNPHFFSLSTIELPPKPFIVVEAETIEKLVQSYISSVAVIKHYADGKNMPQFPRETPSDWALGYRAREFLKGIE